MVASQAVMRTESPMVRDQHRAIKSEVRSEANFSDEDDTLPEVTSVPSWLPKHVVGAEIISERSPENDDPFYVVDITMVSTQSSLRFTHMFQPSVCFLPTLPCCLHLVNPCDTEEIRDRRAANGISNDNQKWY